MERERVEERGGMQKVKTKELAEDSPFKAKGYTVVKQWSFDDSKFKRVARPDIYKSSMVRLSPFYSCVCVFLTLVVVYSVSKVA